MTCWLPYGDGEYPLELSGGEVKNVLEGIPLPVAESEEEEVARALEAPIDSAPLSELVKEGEKVCIIVGDMTRLWVRHHVLLPPIVDALNRAGVPDRDIFIVSATGDHREQSPEEHRQIAGEEMCARFPVYDHRARAEEELVFLGHTAFGTPVSLNRRVVEADRVILTGGIVYHFLAGWGGGKKAVLPGISGFETIMKNHSLAFHPEPGRGIDERVRAGVLDGNPCSEDMVQGTSLLGPDFLVNSIINEEAHRTAKVVAGSYLTAFNRGCGYADAHFGVTIDEPAELVIASCGGFPKDINFYQTYKTIYNAHFALREGGTMILLSESREGMGNDDFASIFHDYTSNPEREAALRKQFTIGGYMGYHSAVIAEKNDLLVLTEMEDAAVRAMGMTPMVSLEEGLEFVRQKHGAIPPCYVMPHGGTTLPRTGKR